MKITFIIVLFALFIYIMAATRPDCKEGFSPVWMQYSAWQCLPDGRK